MVNIKLKNIPGDWTNSFTAIAFFKDIFEIGKKSNAMEKLMKWKINIRVFNYWSFLTIF